VSYNDHLIYGIYCIILRVLLRFVRREKFYPCCFTDVAIINLRTFASSRFQAMQSLVESYVCMSTNALFSHSVHNWSIANIRSYDVRLHLADISVRVVALIESIVTRCFLFSCRSSCIDKTQRKIIHRSGAPEKFSGEIIGRAPLSTNRSFSRTLFFGSIIF